MTFGENQAIELHTGGVKCDNPACDYRDDTFDIPVDKAGRQAFVGTPCPKCGASLLTLEDADLMEDMLAVTSGLNKMFDELRPELREALMGDGARVRIPIGMDGTGTAEFDLRNIGKDGAE